MASKRELDQLVSLAKEMKVAVKIVKNYDKKLRKGSKIPRIEAQLAKRLRK